MAEIAPLHRPSSDDASPSDQAMGSDQALGPDRAARSDQASSTPDVARSRGREPLWRHMLGDHLRRLRHERGETLWQAAGRAGVSPQYVSEIERGIKDPSSEMIAAVAGALEVTLVDLTLAVAEDLIAAQTGAVQTGGAQVGAARAATCQAAFALAA